MHTGGSRSRRHAPGMVLIFTAGVLAILAAMGTAFYAISQSGTAAAVRYSDMVRADLLARAGIAEAIARLRTQAYIKPEDPGDTWFMTDYLHGLTRKISFPFCDGRDNDTDGIIDNEGETEKVFTRALGEVAGADSDRYTLEVSDAASKINVNAGDNLAVILDNLCRLIGPPLTPAQLNMLQPRRWYTESNNTLITYGYNNQDTETSLDVCYETDTSGRPVQDDKSPYMAQLLASGKVAADLKGAAVFGDGYAIAGFRARNGRFTSLEQVKQALTFVDRNNNGVLDDPLEVMEVETKFAALKPYLTTDSWVDTTTVSVGKFEWALKTDPPQTITIPKIRDIVTGAIHSNVPCQVLIDRDKSWVADDPVGDPKNERGSLRGSYVAIVNGHGAGQLRRIATNGADWIALYGYGYSVDESMVVPPGPVSSYMLIAREDAKLSQPTAGGSGTPLVDSNGKALYLPETDVNGQFVDDPDVDYERFPLCIHRAPVNINTASDKVLAALLMGLNVTHGNFMSVGLDTDIRSLAGGKAREAWNGDTDPDWKINDYNANPIRTVEPYILTPKGLKRIPADKDADSPSHTIKGQPAYDVDWDTWIKPSLPASYGMDYIGNNGSVDPAGTTKINEAQELAFRIMVARQPDPAYPYISPANGVPAAAGNEVYKRQPFRSWDDLYFRVVKPWDDSRINPTDALGNANPRYNAKRGSVARLIMANFNSNLDILKFNPNIEWVDRFGRNFTEMEPVMVYTNTPEGWKDASLGHGALDIINDTIDAPNPCDMDGVMNNTAIPIFTRERNMNYPPFSLGTFGDDPRYMGAYVIRSYRYKADEMIDKTDLNRSTTEFVFDSNGIFHVVSSGQVVSTVTGQLLAERKLESLVKVYEVWRETTQRQFVNGYISRAAGNPGTPSAGSITRDATNVNSRLALTTLPEALVPLGYRFSDATKIREVVDTSLGSASRKRDAWGNIVTELTKPDVLSNCVQPAGYDGQIVLATNTLRYDPSETGDADTFLASFNGDVDTDTCRGIGREQAKTPLSCRVRVTDTCSLLGLLNDRFIDTDPGLRGNAGLDTPVVADTPPYGTTVPLEIWRYKVAVQALRGLDPRFYWNNVSCRQGDLRPDGVYVGGAGIAGNEGVLKYLCGHDGGGYSTDMNFTLNGPGAVRAVGEDRNNWGSIGDHQGFLMSCWAKTMWHHNDGRNHDFFDCTTPGWSDKGIRAEAFTLRKQGRAQWAICERRASGAGLVQVFSKTDQLQSYEDGTWGISGSGNRVDDFSFINEHEENAPAGDWSEPDWPIYLHGGVSGLKAERLDPTNANYRPESPSYRFQPFRWQFVGARMFLQPNYTLATNGPYPPSALGGVPGGQDAGKFGHHKPNKTPSGWKDRNSVWTAMNLFRPFVDSERWPETDYEPYGKYWMVCQGLDSTGFTPYQNKGRARDLSGRGDGGQHVRWRWASPGGTAANSLWSKTSINDFTIFGMNNCNPGEDYKNCNSFCSIYKNSPDEGTYAVIDEYKLSRKETVLKTPSSQADDRITRSDAAKPGEMTTSRYYTPADPTVAAQCPTFTSQTLLQSKRGYDKKTSTVPEYVTLARVSWNAFTPRFMAEYKRIGNFTRPETITVNYQTTTFVSAADSPSSNVGFRGPFDYCKYNNIWCKPNAGGEVFTDWDDPAYDSNVSYYPYRCTRPTPAQYQAAGRQCHATRGVEVELLEDADDNPGNSNETVKAGPFWDPAPYLAIQDTTSGSALNKVNAVGTALNPVKVRVDRLRYRVRFRYYVDRLADTPANTAGRDQMDVANQYVLDTPVFDDISVALFDKVKILDYREVNE